MTKMNGKVGFSEYCVCDNPKLVHYCDSYCVLIQYPKNKTMNEMRRDVFFEMHSDNNILTYTNVKNNVKPINKKLHGILYNRALPIALHAILTQYDVVEFITIPPCFNIKIYNGRFIDYDGNQKDFIGENKDHFYVCKWNGS